MDVSKGPGSMLKSFLKLKEFLKRLLKEDWKLIKEFLVVSECLMISPLYLITCANDQNINKKLLFETIKLV